MLRAILLLLFIGIVKAEYDESIAKKMLVLAAAAYSPNHRTCLSNRFTNSEVISTYSLACDITKNTTCSGYVAVLHDDKIIAVAFRGTSSDFQMFEEVISGLEDKPNFLGIGRVNDYFYNGYLTLWTNGMARKVYQLADKYPDYKLWITGHSLGAALATLASTDLAVSGRFNVKNSVHYSFGQPRVGDYNFAIIHDLLLPNYYRVTHAQDFISDQFIPALGYIHHGTQVWYNNDMSPGSKYIICALDFDPKCFGPLRVSMDDHRHYFGQIVSQYGERGCKEPIV